MGSIAIRTDTLSKTYRLGQKSAGYQTLRDQLTEAVAAPFRTAGRLLRQGAAAPAAPVIAALTDVSFDIDHGELVGIIGRNGAGKSTLLKILSRITEPTSGYAELHGRVASLLEVGTGFHQELTGRENIYLSGAILGMKRAEIIQRFDEIVAFAETEAFLDTALKHYSTGMYLRLAFAVAAHLEPEILIVDEVLAVGDMRFQQKCLNKMHAAGREGRTVLLVSHNMQAITRLCERAILLDGGRLVADGSSPHVVGRYLQSGLGTTAHRDWPDAATAPAGEVVRLRAARVHDEHGHTADALDIRRPIGIEVTYEATESGFVLSPFFELHNEEGVEIFSTADQDRAWRRRPRPAGRYVSTAWIPGNLLSEGTVFVTVGVARMDPVVIQFKERDAVAFQVIDSAAGDSARGDWGGPWGGAVRPLLEWHTRHGDGSVVSE